MIIRTKNAIAGVQTKNSAMSLAIKSVTDEGVIEGYASVFGVVDQGGDVVEPGAFADSLAKSKRTGRKVKMLWQHDRDQPIGVWDDLHEDGKGLYGVGRLLIEQSPKAREAHGLVKAEALDGLSIGYRTITWEPKEGKPGVISLKQLELLEVSIVTFAMNERAKIEVIKSTLDAGHMPTVREFEGLLRDAGFSKAKATAIAAAATPHLRGEPDVKANDELVEFLNALRASA